MLILIFVPWVLLLFFFLFSSFGSLSFGLEYKEINRKYARLLSTCQLKGFEIADLLKRGENLDHIQILGSPFRDSYYDNRLKIVSLSKGTWVSESILAVCSSSHEVAHAIQFRSVTAVLMQRSLWVIDHISHVAQKTMSFRKRLVPVVFLGAIAGFTPFVALGLFWSLIHLSILVSIATEVVIEMWARSIALGMLRRYSLASSIEEKGIKELTLSWVKTRIFSAGLLDTVMYEMVKKSIITLPHLLVKKR